MAMEVNSTYGGYSNSYSTISNKRKMETSNDDVKGTNKVSTESGELRRTAYDELSYLSKKYDGYSFVNASYKQGMKYGSKSTVNVAISPEFLKKMANNPELESKYEKEIANMKACDDRLVSTLEGQGDRIIAKGWSIDKDGNISSWVIGERGEKHPKMTSNEYGEKIRKEKSEKKKQAEKIAKKKQNASKKKKEIEKKMKVSQESKKRIKESKDDDSVFAKEDEQQGELFNNILKKNVKIGTNLDIHL